jgi:hypothetical protein
MKDLLDKLSSYNLFNYLLPGTIFAASAETISDYTFHHDNIVVQLFVYYFMGLVISRIGSLMVEPLLKIATFVEFAPYKDFIRACTNDPKIEMLSEQNNMFRTLCALFLALPAFKGLEIATRTLGLSHSTGVLIGSGILCVFFAFAYRKQTGFVKQRVEIGKTK